MTRTILTLITLFTLTAAACGETESFDEQSGLRAVEITEGWGLYMTEALPEYPTCAQVWLEGCAGMSVEQCVVTKDRFTCVESKAGVELTDTYAYEAPQPTWTAISVGDDARSGSEGSAASACETMSGIEPDQCAALAAIADTLVAQLPTIQDLSPAGGVASIIIEDHLLRVVPGPGSDDDVVWSTADLLDWKLPMLATQFAFDAPAGIIVIEDIIMLVVRPNGTLSVSTSRAALMQDASYGVLDDDDDTIDMPIEEELLFPKRKG